MTIGRDPSTGLRLMSEVEGYKRIGVRDLIVDNSGVVDLGPFAFETSDPVGYKAHVGYWNNSAATEAAFHGDSIYRTGDLGCLEASGDLYIRGRRNDLILRGGANVYPAEVERVLLDDDRVAACAVFGVTDPRLGERVCAVIQATAGDAGNEAFQQELTAALEARCQQMLARYKAPQEWHFVEALPRNAMGKIVKHELREQLGLG